MIEHMEETKEAVKPIATVQQASSPVFEKSDWSCSFHSSPSRFFLSLSLLFSALSSHCLLSNFLPDLVPSLPPFVPFIKGCWLTLMNNHT